MKNYNNRQIRSLHLKGMSMHPKIMLAGIEKVRRLVDKAIVNFCKLLIVEKTVEKTKINKGEAKNGPLKTCLRPYMES